MEDYVVSLPKFNKGGRPRRDFQSGRSEAYMHTFQLSSQMFRLRTAYNEKEQHAPLSFVPHEWLQQAVSRRNCDWYINPERPQLFEMVDGIALDLKDCHPRYLRKGDLVCISFRINFILGKFFWDTAFVPLEIVRVGAAPTILTVRPNDDGASSGASHEVQNAVLKRGPVKRARLRAGEIFHQGK